MTHRIAPPIPVMAFPRKTDCATTAPMPTARPWRRGQAPQPQRGAEGAGLDGGDHGRSTIIQAVDRTR